MTNQNEPQKIGINPNPTYVPLTEAQDLSADLEEARQQITYLKSERDSLAGKINQLDIEVAHLKDERSRLEQQRDNLFQNFKDLYSLYQQLYDQVISSNTAVTITAGKLSEALVRCKFTIPQQE